MIDVHDWLKALEQDPDQTQNKEFTPPPTHLEQILNQAAMCYAKADWSKDASRLFKQLGNFKSAAVHYENQGLDALAAQCYFSAKEWDNAARCFLTSNQPELAAESLLKAKKRLQAAWLWAHEANTYNKAKAIINKIKDEKPNTVMGKELILARCEAGQKEERTASRRIKKILLNNDTSSIAPFILYIEWIKTVVSILQRPDLMMETHAAAFRMEIPNARQKWLKWSKEVLGTVEGIPKENHTVIK